MLTYLAYQLINGSSKDDNRLNKLSYLRCKFMTRKTTNKQKILHVAGILGLVIAAWCCQLIATPHTKHQVAAKKSNLSIKSNKNSLSIPGLDSNVLNLALKAYDTAKNTGVGSKEYLTIVDYSMPSTEPRMWVINMRSQTVVHHTHVAHGTGSGDNYAHKFSNNHGSHMSSLGVFVTGKMYNGHYGKSLELHGLDGKYNSNAHARRIVVHAAHYVDNHIIQKIGRLGRSFGCLALNKRIAQKIMHTIKDGSVIFCYYPDKNWLRESTLLNS
jgi:hypothetical protein